MLTFSRKDDDSITSRALRASVPARSEDIMFAVQYGPQFFTGDEYRQYLQRETDFYGEFLAASVFELKKRILGFSSQRLDRYRRRFQENRPSKIRSL